MNEAILLAAVTAEIEALHVAFEHWFRGTTDDPTRISDSVVDGFTFVTTAGELLDGRTVREAILAAHGSRDLRMRVENVVLRNQTAGTALATYEEWHDEGDHQTARLSTVLFARDAAAPGGLRWLHVHETWLVPPPAQRREAAGE